MDFLYLLLLFFMLVILANEACTLLFTKVPTVTSFKPVRLAMRDVVAAYLQEKPSFEAVRLVDLGSAYGQLTRELAAAFPALSVAGYEISPVPYFYAWLRARLAGLPNLQYWRKDFWHENFAAFDVVIVFLDVKVAGRISDKLHAELKPGALLISNEIAMGANWTAPRVLRVGLLQTALFIYQR